MEFSRETEPRGHTHVQAHTHSYIYIKREVYFKELAHTSVGLVSMKFWTGWQAGDSRKNWCFSLEFKFHRAAGLKLKQAFCFAVLRQNSFFKKLILALKAFS